MQNVKQIIFHTLKKEVLLGMLTEYKAINKPLFYKFMKNNNSWKTNKQVFGFNVLVSNILALS